jgi:benzil reductase ((S)-benzoin forming)
VHSVRTVVITGVSRGLGAALFVQLHARGDHVVAIGRSFTAEQRALPGVTLLQADLADPRLLPDTGALAPLLAGADEAALVHNAAVVEPIGPVGMLGADRIAAAVAVNLTAPMALTDAFLAALGPSTSRVRILFISSGAAQRPIEGWAPYSATKRGGEMFFEVLAAEAARRDPRVSVRSVNPGVMDTAMQERLRAADFPSRERYLRLHEADELPDPADVARRVIAEHLTGDLNTT